MISQISFATDRFESQAPYPRFISPRNFGEDLAKWAVNASRDSGFKLGSPFQTEAGWSVPAQAGGESFEIGGGIMDASVGDAQANWLITVEKKRKWKVFSPRDSALRSELCDHIQDIFRDKAHISEIRCTDQVGHFAR